MNFTKIILLLVCSCFIPQSCSNDDEPKTKFKDITLNCGKTYTITNGSVIDWTSSNKYIVSVVGNTITAERIGDAIISSSKGSFKVSVKGTISDAYFIPCINWGASKSTVKEFMKDFSINKETSTELSYKSNGAQILTSYTFENSKLASSGLALNGDYINSNHLIEFMLERYVPVSYNESSYSFYFVTPDNKTALGLMLDSYGSSIIYIIAYIPRNNSRNSFVSFDWAKFNKFGFNKSEVIKSHFNHIKSYF